jgi:hypothetical protein
VKLVFAVPESVGGSFTPTTVTVSLCGALSIRPSLTVQARTRLLSEPKSVGLSLVDVNCTDWSAVW